MLRCNRLLHKTSSTAVLSPTAVLSHKLFDGSAEKEPSQKLRFVPGRGLRTGIKNSYPLCPHMASLLPPIWGLEAVENKEDSECKTKKGTWPSGQAGKLGWTPQLPSGQSGALVTALRDPQLRRWGHATCPDKAQPGRLEDKDIKGDRLGLGQLLSNVFL